MWVDPRIRLGQGSDERASHRCSRSRRRASPPSSASRSPRSGSSCGGASASTSLRSAAPSCSSLFYIVSLFADFFAYADPHESDAQRSLIAPQTIHWFDDGRFAPYVHPLKGTRDPRTFKRVYVPDPAQEDPAARSSRTASPTSCSASSRRIVTSSAWKAPRQARRCSSWAPTRKAATCGRGSCSRRARR